MVHPELQTTRAAMVERSYPPARPAGIAVCAGIRIPMSATASVCWVEHAGYGSDLVTP